MKFKTPTQGAETPIIEKKGMEHGTMRKGDRIRNPKTKGRNLGQWEEGDGTQETEKKEMEGEPPRTNGSNSEPQQQGDEFQIPSTTGKNSEFWEQRDETPNPKNGETELGIQRTKGGQMNPENKGWDSKPKNKGWKWNPKNRWMELWMLKTSW